MHYNLIQPTIVHKVKTLHPKVGMPRNYFIISLTATGRVKSKYLNKYEENWNSKKTFGKVNFMSGTYHERDEDWMVTCPECHGAGTIGTGDSRIRCSKCGGSGRIKR